MSATYTYATAIPASIPVVKTKCFLGTKATSPDSDAFVEIGGVTAIPEFGPTDNPITISVVNYELDITEKGTIKPGGGDLMCVYIEGDAGQEALAAARDDRDGNYNFRMIFPNKPTTNGTGTIIDLKCKVMSASTQMGAGQDYVKFKATLAFNSLPVKTDPAST